MNNNTGNSLEDRQLVARVLDGDPQAFGTIIRNTERLVAQIVFRMVDNPEDRKDMVQEIYLKAYGKLSGFRFGSRLSTWIGQISYNTCVDHLRKKKLIFTAPLPGDAADGGEEAGAMYRQDAFPEVLLDRKALASLLQAEIERLPPVFRTLITLYHQEACSYEEMEQITGLPAGTVKSYLFRARKTLKDRLLQQYKKEDL